MVVTKATNHLRLIERLLTVSLSSGEPYISGKRVLILSGDVPLTRAETLRKLIDEHQQSQNALTLLIGILSANVGAVVGFYFGSSSQAKKQADTIDTLAKTAQTAGAALTPAEPAIPVAPGESVTVKGEEAR